MALKGQCETYDKIGLDEEFFTLRAQDRTAPKVVIEWIAANIYNENASDQKLREAFDCALKMRHFQNRKLPD